MSFVQDWCEPNVSFFNAAIVEPYFCLYVGTNLLEMLKKEREDYIISGFCDSVHQKSLNMRQNFFDKLYKGDNCVDTYEKMDYEGSVADTYDPIMHGGKPDEMCKKFEDMRKLLKQAG